MFSIKKILIILAILVKLISANKDWQQSQILHNNLQDQSTEVNHSIILPALKLKPYEPKIKKPRKKYNIKLSKKNNIYLLLKIYL